MIMDRKFMDNRKFVSISDGKIQLNTDAITDIYKQWDELKKRDPRRQQNANISEFFSTLQQNIEQFTKVAEITGAPYTLKNIKGVPEGFSKIHVLKDKLQFPNLGDAVMFIDDMKDEFGDYYDITSFNDYKAINSEFPGYAHAISGKSEDTIPCPMIRYNDTNNGIGKALLAIGNGDFNKCVFLNSTTNQIEAIFEKVKDAYTAYMEHRDVFENVTIDLGLDDSEIEPESLSLGLGLGPGRGSKLEGKLDENMQNQFMKYIDFSKVNIPEFDTDDGKSEPDDEMELE